MMAVDIAYDGLDAAAKRDQNAYDVVVLDRDLTGIHGDALCQMITERHDRVMVLMLTAAGAPGDRVSGLTLGAEDCLAVLMGSADASPARGRAAAPHRHHIHRRSRRREGGAG
ncbi:response regulator [Streptomyces sp. NPDC048483]|uniref:response regulator n=1 Tax=Streptomyces sp. NPDC048483 TaxID=3154927 RepID=UPI00341ADF98